MQRRIKYWNEYHNPFYYWWKVRKLFKFKYKLYVGEYHWSFGDYIRKSPVTLRFIVLGWKTKYGSFRHEWNPCIYFKFFKWQIRFIIGPIKECTWYWETILDWVYNEDKLTFAECVNNNTWESLSKGGAKNNVFLDNLLTKKGKKLYLQINK